MPELPEVETLVRAVRPVLEGRHVQKVIVQDRRVLDMSPERFARRLRGRRIERVYRRGKWIVMPLDSGEALLIQLRMTGQIRLVPPERNNHVRLRFALREGGQFWYCDTRCLGSVALLGPPALAEQLSQAHQGPEALEITLSELSRRLARTRRSIKPTLLDQRVLSGIGNLYADEILHVARLHPERLAAELTPQEQQRLHRAIGCVLRAAIESRGSTLRDGRYQTAEGQPGDFQAQHQVYGRAGQPCRRCGTPVARRRIRGLASRSSYFCPRCQPAHGSPEWRRKNP